MYVPGFADALMADPIPGLNFQGWAVGDGWTGCKAKPGKPMNWCVDLDNVGLFKYPNVYPGPYYDVEFFHGHSQYSNTLYREIKRTCSEPELRGETNLTKPCSGLINEMSKEVGYFFPYNLYNSCPSSAMVAPPPKTTQTKSMMPGDKHGANSALRARRAAMAQLAGRIGSDAPKPHSGLSSPCLGTAMNTWLLQPDTLEAIGAPANISFINLDNGHGFNYTSDRQFVGDIYEKAMRAGLRVMIYEGDVDACGLQTANVEDIFVPLFESIGANQTQRWRPWTVDGQQHMGGYVIEWEMPPAAEVHHGKARFVSLRGSGHLAPLNRPHVSQVMMEAFTAEQTLPHYQPPPPPPPGQM